MNEKKRTGGDCGEREHKEVNRHQSKGKKRQLALAMEGAGVFKESSGIVSLKLGLCLSDEEWLGRSVQGRF